jgi:beta-galactosidase
MDQMHVAGIQVILDIAGLPAPLWLHHKYPSVDLVTQQGTPLDPAERYMDDIASPDYRRLVVRFADTLTRRYANHPALLAIGFNNKIGNGFMPWASIPVNRRLFVRGTPLNVKLENCTRSTSWPFPAPAPTHS